MKTMLPALIVGVALLGCAQEAAAPAARPAPAPASARPSSAATQAPAAPTAAPAPKPDNEKTVVDVALGSPDHTTLVAALKAAELVVTLNSPGGVYTVFAPTNAAFEKLPPGTVENLLKPEQKLALKGVLQHHATVPIYKLTDLKDGQVLSMADGKKVTVHVAADGKVNVDGANVLASVPALNGIVHVVDAVIVPPAQ
jgi:uncharacterized surface protein with fasciclin (FAS1) repeats